MSNSFLRPIDVRWSDLDPNYHVRHSTYYDYGAYSRICFLNENGITTAFFTGHHFGPILFREECIFRREIKLGDAVTIDLQLLKSRSDHSRWTIQHKIIRNGELAATLVLDGAWIDAIKRKLTIPPELARDAFNIMPRAENFEWIK
ncbi:MAG: thioesterase family protein [Chitinophagaceae bacterium]|nr:thioesterase family protein [Chitinophagaceae bacterium]